MNIYPLIVCIATPSWFFLFTFQTDNIIVIFISFCRSLFCRNNRYHQLENTHKNFRSIVYNILLAKVRTCFQGKFCNYLFINVIYLTTVSAFSLERCFTCVKNTSCTLSLDDMVIHKAILYQFEILLCL